jgi:ABC-2 type transport system permease protein
MNLRPFTALVAKDLKLYLGNPRAVILTIAVPIAIASFFGYIFGGGAGKGGAKGSGVSLLVVDLDRSAISSNIVASLAADAQLKVTLASESEARQAVRAGKAPVTVIFPKNFGDDASRSFFGRNKKPEVTVLNDPSRSMEAQMVQGLLMQHIMQTVSREMFSGTTGRNQVRESLAQLDKAIGLAPADRSALRDLLGSVDKWMDRAPSLTNAAGGTNGFTGGLTMPFTTKTVEAVNPVDAKVRGYNGYAHSFGGMGVQFVLLFAIDCGLAMLLERQRGLWRRLRAAPLSRGTLLAGRAASTAIITFATFAACWAFVMIVFGVRVRGSWLGFVACNAGVAIFAASLGLLIASLGRTPEATRGIAIFVILMLVMLGGAWVPTFIFPQWLQTVTLGIPTRWAVDGLDAMTWRGLGLEEAVLPVLVLLGYSVALFAIATRCFRWEAE